MKRGLRVLVWIVLAVVLAGLLFIRLAPMDATKVHQPVTATADKTGVGNAVRVIAGDAQVLAQVDSAARALARTQVVAGSVEDGIITYVTRSQVFGFPDYTTVQLVDDQIRMFARLRFGRSDFGVNAARLEELVGAVQ